MKFHVVFEKSEDDWIVAKCPALPGCVTQGKTKKEAKESIKDAIESWLWAEDMKALEEMNKNLKKKRKEPVKSVLVSV